MQLNPAVGRVSRAPTGSQEFIMWLAGPRRPPPTAIRTAAPSVRMSPSGSPTGTSWVPRLSAGYPCTAGQEDPGSSPMPIVTINTSIRLARFPPGLRRRIRGSSPAIDARVADQVDRFGGRGEGRRRTEALCNCTTARRPWRRTPGPPQSGTTPRERQACAAPPDHDRDASLKPITLNPGPCLERPAPGPPPRSAPSTPE